MKHRDIDDSSNIENFDLADAPILTPEKVEIPFLDEEDSNVSEESKDTRQIESSPDDKKIYWEDETRFKPTNQHLLFVGKILTIIAGCTFAFAVLMFFVPATNIKMKSPAKASFSFNNIYALLLYYSIALIMSFSAGIILSLSEFKIHKSFKLKKANLRDIELKERRTFAGLTFVNRTVFVLSLSLIIVIAFFMWLLSWISIPVKLLETLGIL